jgi:hypothetical protein
MARAVVQKSPRVAAWAKATEANTPKEESFGMAKQEEKY